MRIRYLGPADRLRHPGLGLSIAQGEEVELAQEAGEELLTLPGHDFEEVKQRETRRRVEAEEEAPAEEGG